MVLILVFKFWSCVCGLCPVHSSLDYKSLAWTKLTTGVFVMEFKPEVVNHQLRSAASVGSGRVMSGHVTVCYNEPMLLTVFYFSSALSLLVG